MFTIFGLVQRPVMGMPAWTRSSLLVSKPQGLAVVSWTGCPAACVLGVIFVHPFVLGHVVPQQILLAFLTLVRALLALELAHHPQQLIGPT